MTEQTPLTPDEIANQFIKQYKRYQLGLLNETVFTMEQSQAMIASCIHEPDLMAGFFNNVIAMVKTIMEEEEAEPDDIINAISHLSSVLLGFTINIITTTKIIMAKNNSGEIIEDDLLEEIPEDENSFDCLDFKLRTLPDDELPDF